MTSITVMICLTCVFLTGVECVNLRDGDGFMCLSCPEGFYESEGSCVDIDECEEFAPCCSPLNVTCTNKASDILMKENNDMTSSSVISWCNRYNHFEFSFDQIRIILP